MENTKIFSKTLLKNQYLELENNNLEELIQKHESCIYSDSNLSNSIEELTSKIRDGKIGKNKFLGAATERDGLLGALRRIDISYTKSSNHDIDIQEMNLLCLFHYSKVYLEILRKNWSEINIDKNFKKSVTDIRNFFAHAYEKDFEGESTFVRLDYNIQNGMVWKDHNGRERLIYGIKLLNVYDNGINSSKLLAEVYFSPKLIFFEIENLVRGHIKILETTSKVHLSK